VAAHGSYIVADIANLYTQRWIVPVADTAQNPHTMFGGSSRPIAVESMGRVPQKARMRYRAAPALAGFVSCREQPTWR
jgi:hypothetical protein